MEDIREIVPVNNATDGEDHSLIKKCVMRNTVQEKVEIQS